MFGPLEKLVIGFIPDYAAKNEEEQRLNKLFIYTCYITAFFSVVYGAMCVFIDYRTALLLMIASFVSHITLPFLLRLRAPLFILSNYYVFSIFIVNAIIIATTGGIAHSELTAWIPLYVLLALLLQGQSSAIFWVVVAVAQAGFFAIQYLMGTEFPVEYKEQYDGIFRLLSYTGLPLIIFAIAGVFERTKNDALAQLAGKNKIIAIEKEKSDELLLNILPEEAATELKEKGYVDAKHYHLVTVLFTDFKDFSKAAERLSPGDLVALINRYYRAFDAITERHGLEKIKTIGDSYMAAGGLPRSNKTNPEDVINAAVDISQFIKEQLLLNPDNSFEIRMGIHTGPVVAGIVGVKKFAYDIWGDTVNTASRMEQHGEAGKINISQTTYELVKDKFQFVYRGEIAVKSKGMLKMYFLQDR